MSSEALERAAKVTFESVHAALRFEASYTPTQAIEATAAALLVFLDPEDEALIDRIAMNLYHNDAHTTSSSATVALQWPIRVWDGAPDIAADKAHYRQMARAAIQAQRTLLLSREARDERTVENK